MVVKAGAVAGVGCLNTGRGQPDAGGRRRPEPVPGSDFVLGADTILVAAGQQVEQEIRKAGFDGFRRDGTIEAEHCRTKLADVFAGGDAESGPAAMIDAVAAGNCAAKAIINYLEGRDEEIEPFLLPKTDLAEVDMKTVRKQSRTSMPALGPEERKRGFREVELGFSEEEARREALRCLDCSVCSECLACVKACQSGAILHTQQDWNIEVEVSAVLLCPGYDMADEIPPELGYEACEDVVTSMEYERILSASGPYAGHVRRPSDGKLPERIAFLQCVGSRDFSCGADYCSAVCCMYAVKEAQITREHLPSVKDIDLYYMDMRAYGKDFDRYVESGKNKYGINLIRRRAASAQKLRPRRDAGGSSLRSGGFVHRLQGRAGKRLFLPADRRPHGPVRLRRLRPVRGPGHVPGGDLRLRRGLRAEGHPRDRDGGERRRGVRRHAGE
jgi:ferredoxin